MVYFRLFGNLGNLLFQYGTAVTLGGGRAVGVTCDQKTLAQLKECAEVFRGLETVPEPPDGALKVALRVEDALGGTSCAAGGVGQHALHRALRGHQHFPGSMRKVLVGGKRQGGEVPKRAEIAGKIPIKAATFPFARQKAVQL